MKPPPCASPNPDGSPLSWTGRRLVGRRGRSHALSDAFSAVQEFTLLATEMQAKAARVFDPCAPAPLARYLPGFKFAQRFPFKRLPRPADDAKISERFPLELLALPKLRTQSLHLLFGLADGFDQLFVRPDLRAPVAVLMLAAVLQEPRLVFQKAPFDSAGLRVNALAATHRSHHARTIWNASTATAQGHATHQKT